MSLAGGFFGTSMIITSGENIGIVRATNVRSRYVTAAGIALASRPSGASSAIAIRMAPAVAVT